MAADGQAVAERDSEMCVKLEAVSLQPEGKS